MISFNSIAWGAIIVAAGSIALGIEPFKKLYLDRIMDKFGWYEEYRTYIIRAFAIGAAMVMVLASDSLSLAAVFNQAPGNNIAKIGDVIVTSILLSFSEEMLHNFGDILRLVVNLKLQTMRQTLSQKADANA